MHVYHLRDRMIIFDIVVKPKFILMYPPVIQLNKLVKVINITSKGGIEINLRLSQVNKKSGKDRNIVLGLCCHKIREPGIY